MRILQTKKRILQTNKERESIMPDAEHKSSRLGALGRRSVVYRAARVIVPTFARSAAVEGVKRPCGAP
jgi:hypothetical protein